VKARAAGYGCSNHYQEVCQEDKQPWPVGQYFAELHLFFFGLFVAGFGLLRLHGFISLGAEIDDEIVNGVKDAADDAENGEAFAHIAVARELHKWDSERATHEVRSDAEVTAVTVDGGALRRVGGDTA